MTRLNECDSSDAKDLEPDGDNNVDNMEMKHDTAEEDTNADSKDTKKKRRKKRRNKNNDAGCNAKEIDEEMAIIEQFVKECQMQEEADSSKAPKKRVSRFNFLKVETKYLKAENELRRIFGSKVIEADLSKRRPKSRTYKITGRPYVQDAGAVRPLLIMEHVKSEGQHLYFNFVHSKAYQQVQFLFLDAVETMIPQNLMNLLAANPYHVDTLIQLSELCKMTGEDQMAVEFIGKCIHG